MTNFAPESNLRGKVAEITLVIMNNPTIHSMPNLEEYIRQGEPMQRERGQIWQTAIGLQQVDGLNTSAYLLQTAKQHIEGDITLQKAKELIDSYYQSQQVRQNSESEATEEADKVSARIAELLSEKTFAFNPSQLVAIHKHLFTGIYNFAGKIRDYNITKREWVLRSDTVYYAGADMISETLKYDFEQEKSFNYSSVSVDEAIAHLATFCSNIWQIHPFGEGNTRTTAVFMIKYLTTLGFKVNNEIFANNSWYFRNALVRANYTNVLQGVSYNPLFLERFFRNMLLNENHPLQNRELHLDWQVTNDHEQVQSASQSAKKDEVVLSKCKNYTLEELAVLRILQQTPSATQKQIATAIGKSERTIKTLTVNLTNKGIILRRNGKRNGYWEINEQILKQTIQ
jgi:fido (protein-threonine AMPylation protein)